jgi:hypothetical protein
MVSGPGPSARYAHTLALVANRYLVATGGNDGKQTLADAWALDTSDKPYKWQKITDAGDLPPPRFPPPRPGCWELMDCLPREKERGVRVQHIGFGLYVAS